jgi:hypothetical protein
MGFERFDPQEAKLGESTSREIVRTAAKLPQKGKSSWSYRMGQKLLPGVTGWSQDSLIRTIVSGEFQGKTQLDMDRELGRCDGYIKKLKERRPAAFEEARKQHIDTVIERHAQRVWAVTEYLSGTALKAVQTLEGILDDVGASPSVKRRAACDILNLFYVGRAKGEGGRDGVSSSVAVMIQNVMPKAEEAGGEYIVDAEIEDDGDV